MSISTEISEQRFENPRLTMLVGILIVGVWPVYLGVVSKSAGRVLDFYSWYLLAIFYFLGGILWAALQSIKGKNWASLLGLLLIVSVLIILVDFSYARQGRTFYIGNIFERYSGLLGLAFCALNVALVLTFADVFRSYRFGPLMLMVTGYLLYTINYLRNIQAASGTDLNNFIFWISVMIMSGGLISLIVDVMLFWKWEYFSKDGSDA